MMTPRCYYLIVEKLITEVFRWGIRGGTKVSANFRETGAKRHATQGYSFVPSPSANLVGVAKELQQGLSLIWARFKMCFPHFNKQ